MPNPVATHITPPEDFFMNKPSASDALTIPPFGLAGICDCHTHVFPPSSQFPFAGNRHYTPDTATVESLLSMHRRIGVERVVIVHPSPYGDDNSSLLWAMRTIGKNARGVAVISDTTNTEMLNTLHQGGVRGTRLNLETVGQNDPSVAQAQLLRTAKQVAPLGWHIQMYTNLGVITGLHDTIMQSAATVVIDHFGRLNAKAGLNQPGFDALLSLVRSGKVYVKLSAGYRVSEERDYTDLDPFAQALIAANPDRMLWGTDWPHPFPPKGTVRNPDVIEKAHPEDNVAAIQRVVRWAGTKDITRKILVDNPARLYDF
jgi:predicted TIM-barrel fold metal-dependent hydrolase